MRSIFSPHTYHIHAAHKSSLTRGVLAFLSLCLGLALLIEIAARAFFLPFPSLGSDNFLFDYKIYALENLVRREGNPDCLIIGSSVANGNLDPDILQAAYQQASGQALHCFNLGIPALTAETAIPLTEAAIQRYKPRVILFLLIPRDLVDREYTVDHLADNPWVQPPSAKNFLVLNAYSARYFITWQYWLTPANREKMREETASTTPHGFASIQGIRDPYPVDWLMDVESLQKVWRDPQTRPTLDALLALEKHGPRFIIIEAPAYSVAHPDENSPAWQAYESDYIANLQAYLEAKNVPFWRSLEIGKQIPEEGWFDWLHLNSQGAPILSRWVADKLAETPEFFK